MSDETDRIAENIEARLRVRFRDWNLQEIMVIVREEIIVAPDDAGTLRKSDAERDALAALVTKAREMARQASGLGVQSDPVSFNSFHGKCWDLINLLIAQTEPAAVAANPDKPDVTYHIMCALDWCYAGQNRKAIEELLSALGDPRPVERWIKSQKVQRHASGGCTVEYIGGRGESAAPENSPTDCRPLVLGALSTESPRAGSVGEDAFEEWKANNPFIEQKYIYAENYARSAWNAARADADKFKSYVHRHLDEAGVPTHPNGPHSKEGCRIGDRLDILIAQAAESRKERIAGKVEAEFVRKFQDLSAGVTALRKDLMKLYVDGFAGGDLRISRPQVLSLLEKHLGNGKVES